MVARRPYTTLTRDLYSAAENISVMFPDEVEEVTVLAQTFFLNKNFVIALWILKHHVETNPTALPTEAMTFEQFFLHVEQWDVWNTMLQLNAHIISFFASVEVENQQLYFPNVKTESTPMECNYELPIIFPIPQLDGIKVFRSLYELYMSNLYLDERQIITKFDIDSSEFQQWLADKKNALIDTPLAESSSPHKGLMQHPQQQLLLDGYIYELILAVVMHTRMVGHLPPQLRKQQVQAVHERALHMLNDRAPFIHLTSLQECNTQLNEKSRAFLAQSKLLHPDPEIYRQVIEKKLDIQLRDDLFTISQERVQDIKDKVQYSRVQTSFFVDKINSTLLLKQRHPSTYDFTEACTAAFVAGGETEVAYKSTSRQIWDITQYSAARKEKYKHFYDRWDKEAKVRFKQTARTKPFKIGLFNSITAETFNRLPTIDQASEINWIFYDANTRALAQNGVVHRESITSQDDSFVSKKSEKNSIRSLDYLDLANWKATSINAL